MQPGPPCLTVRKSATPVCGAWNPLGTQISALDDPRSCGLGNAPIPYMKKVSEAGDICQHFRRQPYRLLLRHGLRPGRNRLDSPSFPHSPTSLPPGLVSSHSPTSLPPGLVIPRTHPRHSREGGNLASCAIGRSPWRAAVPSRHAAKVNGKDASPPPEANMPRALPSAPYLSIGAPTMLPYSVQEPS